MYSSDDELFSLDGKTIRGIVSLTQASRQAVRSPMAWSKLPYTYDSARHAQLPPLASEPGRHIKIRVTHIIESNLERQIEQLLR